MHQVEASSCYFENSETNPHCFSGKSIKSMTYEQIAAQGNSRSSLIINLK
jgi:hypothetical protein